MKTVLVTGGAGFFGELLIKQLLNNGFYCVSIDLEDDQLFHPNLVSIKGDIRNLETLEPLFSKYKFEVVFHCAAILAHAVKDKNLLWTSNVDGTKNIAELAKNYNVKQFIFISSNCLWAENFKRAVREEDIPKPVEIYGKSKWEAEKILLNYRNYFNVIIFRTPTIIDSGRLGLLAILFEFIYESRKVWVVGAGNNKYQFIYAQDLVNACLKAMDYNDSDIFNVGSDGVKSFKEVYNYVIQKANTRARVASLPKKLTLLLMKATYLLKMSPLGPYQYKMIAESFVFDTSKVKAKLEWEPTLTNEEMLYKGYEYYSRNIEDIRKISNVSAHKQPAKMGIIKLLKWLS